MKNREKNLKHGYIFLSGILLILFVLSLSVEIYFKGGFSFIGNSEDSHENKVENERKDDEEIFLEIRNLTNGFQTKDEVITVVAFTNTGNKSWINGAETDVNIQGVLEGKVDLIIGDNEIIVEVESEDSQSMTKKLTVIREKEEKSKQESTNMNVSEANKPETSNEPNLPTNTPTDVPPVEHQEPSPLMGLKMRCSITNTQPYIGQSVILDCVVKDQNNSFVREVIGDVTVNWQSGNETYPLSNSNGSGVMNISFTVPKDNAGKVLGSVQVSKGGLTVSSSFSLEVQ